MIGRTGRYGATLVIAAALTLSACGTTTSSSGSGKSDGGPIKIGVVSGSAANPFVQAMDAAMESRAKEQDVDLSIETSETVEEQIEKADALIAQGVDYLGLHPWDGEAIKPLIDSANAQGVKVVILIDGVPGVVEDKKALTFISGDELAAAQQLGEWVAEKAGDAQSQVALITGTPGNLAAENRTEGFKAGIEGSSVEIVAESTADWARDDALRVANDMLTANSNLDLIFGENDEMALGALAAVKEAGAQDNVTVLGWNGTCIGLKALLDGDFALEAVLPFDLFGAEMIDAAVDDAAGKSVPAVIAPEVPVISTADAEAILAGKQDASDSLVERLKDAKAGNCE